MRLLRLRADAQKLAQTLEVTKSALAKRRENCQTDGSDVTAPPGLWISWSHSSQADLIKGRGSKVGLSWFSAWCKVLLTA